METSENCADPVLFLKSSPRPQFHIVNRFRDDLTSAVKAAFTKQEPDPRTRFHEQFRKEADEYDQDFHRKYHDDFNSTLIFVRSYPQ